MPNGAYIGHVLVNAVTSITAATMPKPTAHATDVLPIYSPVPIRINPTTIRIVLSVEPTFLLKRLMFVVD